MLDRIDLHIEVTPVPFSELNKPANFRIKQGDPSSRVIRARQVQSKRYEKEKTHSLQRADAYESS